MPKPLLLLLLTLVSGGGLLAQDASPSPTPILQSRVPLWTCKLPGGTYEVRLSSIVAVSSHEYIVDGAARVTEVNIDTTGNSLVRFYYLEPMTPTSPIGLGQSALNKLQDYAKEAATRTDTEEVWEKVVKNYPTSTHAHTVEYRLDSKDDLDKIFTSVDTALRQQRDTLLTVAEGGGTPTGQ
jgi:hypothetical protein